MDKQLARDISEWGEVLKAFKEAQDTAHKVIKYHVQQEERWKAAYLSLRASCKNLSTVHRVHKDLETTP